MERPQVLLCEPMDERATEYLREHVEVVWASGLDEASLAQQVGCVDGLIIRANGAVTRRVMEAAPRLKVIGRHGVGVDHIDIAAASEHGIYVVNTPVANAEAVAEHALAMLLVLAKRIGEADRALRAGCWNARYACTGWELRGRILGVVGLGRIGCRLSELGHAIGMDILYCDVVRNRVAEERFGARYVSLRELLGAADVVSLHVPLTPSTWHLIGRAELALMKPAAILLNTARGAVVDTAALLEALQSQRLAGAGLDVYEDEPLPPASPLLQLDNVVVTPHMAAHTAEALYRMAMVAEDVVAVLAGRAPRFPVNGPF